MADIRSKAKGLRVKNNFAPQPRLVCCVPAGRQAALSGLTPLTLGSLNEQLSINALLALSSRPNYIGRTIEHRHRRECGHPLGKPEARSSEMKLA